MRSDLEVVQVRLQAVAPRNPRDRLVAGAHDDVFALAEAEREHLALPPRQHAPAFVGLLVQVLRRFAPCELVEPDELALPACRSAARTDRDRDRWS